MDIFASPRLGLLVPPENPVAEPEYHQLLGSEMNVYTTRFPVTPGFTRETMEMYNEVLPEVLATFGAMRLDAAVVACNASHYLLDPDGDRDFCAELSERCGFPVLSTTRAILDLCEALGVSGLTLVSPYASWLTELSRGYWEKAGLTVERIVLAPAGPNPPGRGEEKDEDFNPYLVTTKTLLERVREAGVPEDGTVLFTGTGMGTLPAATELAAEGTGRTLITSNMAAAWWARRTAGLAGAGEHALLRRIDRTVR
ncbi:arylmalonate decarboxylase [Streptomyces sp. NPDC051909]|uniref:maleate cis-trans isomerase family protein n=1 Tax=Streptomyces sp. NPDC051909 TaxID=3154944 RepID=UPI00342A4351